MASASQIGTVAQRGQALVAKAAARRRWLRIAAATVSPGQRDVRRVRRGLAARFIAGEGLEIGALHLPLPVPRGARVRYVDRMSREQLRREYPELRAHDLVPVDMIDDGETLATVASASVDFVIANHFIEHTEDPLGALRAHARVLRPGGVLFMAVPDKRATFDRPRAVTPLEHVARDAEEGPEWSRDEHYEDYARHVDATPGATVAERVRWLRERNYSIHFHVWTPAAFAELLTYARTAADVPLELEALVPVRHEFVCVLRRSP